MRLQHRDGLLLQEGLVGNEWACTNILGSQGVWHNPGSKGTGVTQGPRAQGTQAGRKIGKAGRDQVFVVRQRLQNGAQIVFYRPLSCPFLK